MEPLEHSGRVNSIDCPVLGCSGLRDVRIEVRWRNDGDQRVVTGCERHIMLLAARALARMRAMRGDPPLAARDEPVHRCIS